MIETGNSVWY